MRYVEHGVRGVVSVLDDRLIYPVGDQLFMRLAIERRVLPAAVVRQATDERVAEREAEGMFVGRRERLAVRDEVTAKLMAQAFTTRSEIRTWLDPAAGLLLVDAASRSRADLVADKLAKAHPCVPIWPLRTTREPCMAMKRWVTTEEPPGGFDFDSEYAFKGFDGDRATCRGETPTHVAARDLAANGMQVAKVALSFGPVTFLLTDTGNLSRIRWSDMTNEHRGEEEDTQAIFEADFARMTGTYQRIVDALLKEFGGIKTSNKE